MKTKVFRFKNTLALIEFRRSWTGVEHRALVDFIGEDQFKILNITPLGNIYKISRIKDGEAFSSSMGEVIIHGSELNQYFEEVPHDLYQVQEVKSPFNPELIQELHRCSFFTINKLAMIIQRMEYMGLNGSTGQQLAAMQDYNKVIQELKAEIIANGPKL